MWAYLLLTAVTFYLLVPGVVVTLPGLGVVSPLMVHAVVFVLVHAMLHKVLRN